MSASGCAEDPTPETGWVEAELAAEHPGLGLRWILVDIVPGVSPPELRERLRVQSNRFHGARAVAMRQEPIPSAYRVFYRQVGVDPDVDRPPLEEVAVRRLIDGGFTSRNLLDDALLLALLDTGVPLWALDAATLDGPLGIRPAHNGEPFGRGEGGNPLLGGRLVVADAAGPVAMLFGDVAHGSGVTATTRRAALFAVGVDGVPAIHVEEALWACAGSLAAGD